MNEKLVEEVIAHKVILARMEEKLDNVDYRLDTYNTHLEEHMRRSDALETKVDELYKWKYYVMGAIGVFIFLSQLLVKYL